MNWWYLSEDNQQQGPLPEEEFRKLTASGKISSSTLVWHEGMPAWVAYSEAEPAAPAMAAAPAATAQPAEPAQPEKRPLSFRKTMPAPGSPSNCKNHADVPAAARCAGCQEAFCAACLVEIQGRQYCGSCKVVALKGAAPIVEEASLPCPEANEALKYAIIGIFCFGIILEPMAISKAINAKKMIAANPRLMGSGKATAALIIGIISLVLWVLGIVARIKGMG